jgi:hypothetical protein|tara:strand:- start:5820 stop:6425 length:606 start_codon:yes stop_codon:yes gene_type:complete
MGLIKESILVYQPNKVENDVFFSKIMDGTSEITFQIPKTKIYFDKDKEKCKILLDEASISELECVSKNVIRITSEKSNEFFGKEIDIESCSSLYRNAISDGNLLNCFYSGDTYFFDRKNELNISEIPDETSGIVLLKGDVIVYTKTAFYIRWEIQQMKVKTEKSSKQKETLLTEYSIIDIPEDEIDETEKIAKKIKEICLF